MRRRFHDWFYSYGPADQSVLIWFGILIFLFLLFAAPVLIVGFFTDGG